ncbi:MAG: winged helix-turn-helix domain-containing protein [Pyrinomonadaceae bacterium]
METIENKRVVYEFGRFVLDPREKTLSSNGVPIRLPAKGFDTLLLLVEHNGHALTKEEMMSAIWQDAFVEESNLAKQISLLRKIFNGDALIETLPKHGYRFSAEVGQIAPAAAAPILEKRTVHRVTLRTGEETKVTPLALPPIQRNVFRYAVPVILILISLSFVGWALFWPESEKSAENSSFSVLTDGKFDDEFAEWTNQGRIYFRRYITSTHIESWQMNADGSNLSRANTEIKNLQTGRWSPDGKKVIFSKENDGRIFYLADANGSNEIVLPFIPGNMDWSPDGTQFVYQSDKVETGENQIYLYTLATGENVKLTNTKAFGNADPSFSPDGKQIAFVTFHHGNAEIYTMNTDGSNVRRVTNHPAFDHYPVFTPDGTAIAFQSNRENERSEIYLQNLETDSPPVKISNLEGETGIGPKCWSADGAEILLFNNQTGKSQIVRAEVEPYRARIVLSDAEADLNLPRLAPDGSSVLYQARLADRSVELRITDLETQATKTIFKTAPDTLPNHLLLPAWSPDGGSIVFNNKTNGNSEIFIINADGTDLRNLTNEPLMDSYPVFSPDGSEIIFTRHFYDKTRLYRMDLNGSNQRLIKEKEGYEGSAAFSPDGSVLAFAGDRVTADSSGLDIYMLGFRNPTDETRLTARRFHENSPAFSPDGKRIAFVSTADGNAEIYLMNADGTGVLRLTHTKTEEAAPQFTSDGKKLIFAANRGGKFAIYEIELPFEVG